MADDATSTVNIAAFYGPFIGPDALALLVRACAAFEDFRTLAERPSSTRFMAQAIELVPPSAAKLDEWVVKVAARYLEALVDQEYPGMLESIAHQDFLLGECSGWSKDVIADECLLRDGTDASEWVDATGPDSVSFWNTLVRDYFVARYIVDGNSVLLLRFEFPERWVLMFLALLAPGLLTNIAASRTERIRAEIESEVEQKVQAALSHQLKRSAGAVRSHLKSIRRKLALPHFEAISAEFDRITQEVDFQISLSEKSSMWSAQPELRIRDVILLPEIESVIVPLKDRFPTVSATVEVAASLVSRCDRELFREAFFCLAENAFQAASTRSGKAAEQRVDVSAHRAEELLSIRIEIRDNGPGVHADDRERIFAPRVTTKKGGNGHPLGTGMGLPIARKYAELMGGRIGMDTQTAQTCFFLELPASPENPP